MPLSPEERMLRKNESIDRFIVSGRRLVLEYDNDFSRPVRASMKHALIELITFVNQQRVNGHLLTRSTSPNSALTLTAEDKKLLASMNVNNDADDNK